MKKNISIKPKKQKKNKVVGNNEKGVLIKEGETNLSRIAEPELGTVQTEGGWRTEFQELRH